MAGKGLYIIFVATVFSVNCINLNPTSTNPNLLEICLNKVVNKYINQTDNLAAFVEGDLGQSLLKLFSNKILYSSRSNFYLLDKTRVYFIILEQTNSTKLFKKLSSLSTWNPRATFFVITKNKNEIFEEALKYFVKKLLVIEENINEINFYSWSPSVSLCENSTNITKINSCTNENFEDNSNFFLETKPNWKNCELKILTMPISPYVFINLNKSFDGLEIRCLKTIQEIMGFKTKFLPSKYTAWGLRLSNGTYTDMFQKLQNYEADIVVGMWPTNFTHHWDFDASITYLQDVLVWLVPKAQQIPHWKRLAIIFPKNIWITLFLTVLLLPIIWTIAAKCLRTIEFLSFQKWETSILKSISIILNVTIPNFPKSLTLRVIVIIWVYISLILVTIYQSKLLSILIQPQYEYQIQEVDDLLKSGIKLGANVNIKSLFAGTDSEIEQKIYEKMIVCDLTLTCPNRTAYKRDFATAKSKLPADFMILQYFTNSDGSPMIYIFKSTIHTHHVNIVFSKGHPVFEEYNKILFWISESGLLVKWKNDIKDETMRKSFIGKLYSDKSLVLSLAHMETAFKILLVGYIVSSVVFILEFLWTRLNKKLK